MSHRRAGPILVCLALCWARTPQAAGLERPDEDPEGIDQAATSPAGTESSDRLAWFGSNHEPAWAVELGSPDTPPPQGFDPAPTPLTAPPWFPRRPDIQVSMLDGDDFDLASADGHVLILDFWATWCEPCRRELPHLQRLHSGLEDRGLTALTINAEEPEVLVRSFTEELGLTLPVGRYSAELDRAFHVQALPTVVLIDREGRIRDRWDGYFPGLERRIAERVHQLLGPADPEVEPREIAQVLAGSGLLRAEWIRQHRSRLDGLAVIPADGGSPRIAVVAGGTMVLLEASGEPADRIKIPPAVGRVRGADLDGDGRAELVGFRPGGTEIALFDLHWGAYQVRRAPAYVLDAVLVPATDGAPGEVLLATDQGLYRTDLSSEQVRRVGDAAAELTSVALAGFGDAREILALAADGRVLRYDPRGVPRDGVPVPEGSWSLIAGPEGQWGVAPAVVRAAAVGRFLAGAGYQVALATDASQLMLVDLDRGNVRFQARWEGIRALAAADLNGDGHDELLVAAGADLTLLTGESGEPVQP